MSPIVIGVIILAAFVILPMAIKITDKGEYGVIFRLGKLVRVKGPGFFLTIPFIERVVVVKGDPSVVPSDARGYYLRGTVYAVTGMQTEAIADLQKGIELSQDDPSLNQEIEQMIEKVRMGLISKIGRR